MSLEVLAKYIHRYPYILTVFWDANRLNSALNGSTVVASLLQKVLNTKCHGPRNTGFSWMTEPSKCSAGTTYPKFPSHSNVREYYEVIASFLYHFKHTTNYNNSNSTCDIQTCRVCGNAPQQQVTTNTAATTATRSAVAHIQASFPQAAVTVRESDDDEEEQELNMAAAEAALQAVQNNPQLVNLLLSTTAENINSLANRSMINNENSSNYQREMKAAAAIYSSILEQHRHAKQQQQLDHQNQNNNNNHLGCYTDDNSNNSPGSNHQRRSTW